MSLLFYEKLFTNLQLSASSLGDSSSRQQVAMLEAVIALIEKEFIQRNRIYLDQRLINAFDVISNSSKASHLPFFALKNTGFWHHHIKPGKLQSYQSLTTTPDYLFIETHVDFAYLDNALFELLNNYASRELLKTALKQNITSQVRDYILRTGDGWDWLECEHIVNDYFSMLHKELRGENYNKTAHRRQLQTKLNNRSGGSIEYKHRNISAILLKFGQAYIPGYKPAFNYQQQLQMVVLTHLASNPSAVESIASHAEIAPVTQIPSHVDWTSVLDQNLPEKIPHVAGSTREYLARKLNFSERERLNRKLGECGEQFVIACEQSRLTQAGRPDLAREIQWVSQELGDGLGYDIRSFDPTRETELYIEVKTTKSGKYQPFFVTDNELAFSKDASDNFCLYRVYDFDKDSRLFLLPGAIDSHVNLQAKAYKAFF